MIFPYVYIIINKSTDLWQVDVSNGADISISEQMRRGGHSARSAWRYKENGRGFLLSALSSLINSQRREDEDGMGGGGICGGFWGGEG